MTNNPVADLVAVKPLEWRNSYGVMRAETPFGDYIVTRKTWRIGSGMSGERFSDNPCRDAQADYESRILAALTPASAEPVAYQVAMSDGRWGTIFHHPDKPLGDHRPLYAHPPATVTVEAKQINAGDFYDYDAAEKEGWFISYAPGNLDETIWRLERRDENPVFIGGDPEAHTYVVERALEGSKLHQDALDFLRTYEPREYEIVLRHARRWNAKRGMSDD